MNVMQSYCRFKPTTDWNLHDKVRENKSSLICGHRHGSLQVVFPSCVPIRSYCLDLCVELNT